MPQPDSIQSWIEHEGQVERRQALDRTLLVEIPEPVFCAVCYSTRETVMHDRELGIGDVCCVLEDEEPEPEPECGCVPIAADQDDARFCPVHGPHCEAARREREQEASELAAYYGSLTECEVNHERRKAHETSSEI